ncbi:ABC transporter ATP-binding protein [Lipingzhangella sp. LS1_29]|uniref:ABC transporter ATP-binding protein n=1 Tax=Lipingzhangella rawalii TaxID=2055835 RepID=A0ABU2H7S5_9ACTN|nr:ABC transporter ATP-binding protein [Lipingzhangella rawalii]MDS1271356.1 ABC transporter ATP-binding protein [Lipingzhangella rawalii]
MTTTDPDPMLAAHGVTVRFGGLLALNEVNLEAQPGSVVGLIGPNGAGKTTLFNVLSGLITPNAGHVAIRGRPHPRLRPHHLAGLRIARTFQGLNLFPGMTAVDNVAVGADRHARASWLTALTGLGRAARDERELRQRAMSALAEVDASEYAFALPATLPFGVQKRVALARALVSEPEVLLLDEPASGLSEEELTTLGARIRTLSERMTVVLVEHHMDLVMSVCDHIVVLNFGEVISTGSPDEVRNDPKVTQAYLGEPAEDNHA